MLESRRFAYKPARTTILVDRNSMTVLGDPQNLVTPRLMSPLTAPRRAANLNRRRYLALVGDIRSKP